MLVGVAGLAAVLLLPAAPGAATGTAPPGTAAAPDDVFSASIERVQRDPGLNGQPPRYTYTVQVQEVYGESDISSTRVRVLTTSAFGACETRPESRSAATYLWQLTRRATQLVADGCRDVLRATDTRIAAAIEVYGAARSPIDVEPEEPRVEFPEVGYTCPGTTEALSEVTGAESTCSEVAEPRSFDRAAAPGLALILVGALGWIVVWRLNRPRRR